MTFNNKDNTISIRLVLAMYLASASFLIQTAVKAQTNPYLNNKPATKVTPNSTIDQKIKVLTPGGGNGRFKDGDFKDAGNPSLPKFGEADPKGGSFVNFKKPDGSKIDPRVDRPSAGQTLQNNQQQQR